MDRLVRTDKNGTQYWESDTCRKCGGTGYIPYYDYVEAGRCFECGGTGHKHYKWKVYTPEYSAKLEQRRMERYRAKAPERNERKLRSLGFENGSLFSVLGDTYPIRMELKADGARFSPVFGWHFGTKPKWDAVEVRADEVFETNELTGDLELKSDAREIVERKKTEARPSKSKHLYEVGDKVDADVVLSKRSCYETHYTYSGELNFIYVFEDAEGNVYVWKTGRFLEEEVGDTVKLKGTVKENGEYKGTKQTVLTRCKVVA